MCSIKVYFESRSGLFILKFPQISTTEIANAELAKLKNTASPQFIRSETRYSAVPPKNPLSSNPLTSVSLTLGKHILPVADENIKF